MHAVAILSFVSAAAVAATVAGSTRATQPVHEVSIVAKKFTFEPAEVQLVAGEPVRLVIRSADSVHGFALPELKIDVQIPKGGEPVVTEFTAPAPGRYEIVCSEFCGRGHARMKAALVSAAPTRTNR